METWLLISLSLSFFVALAFLLRPNKHKRLPPGPPAVPVLGNLLLLHRLVNDLEAVLRDLRSRYGPIVTLRVGPRINVFISDPRLAHEALVQHGAVFADRPTPLPGFRFISNNQHNINSAAYGPIWRLLRRNLVSETLHPSRMKLFADARAWVLGVLTSKLRARAGDASSVPVVGTFQFSMFCLLALMCFGEKLDEEAIRAIEVATRDALLHIRKLRVLGLLPRISKFLFRKRLNTVVELRQRQKDLYLPLIQARKEHKSKKQDANGRWFVHSYVDSLLKVEIPEEEGRKLTENELVGLCSEFLNAGTDTTSTALEWIMAELVRHPEVQETLWHEVAAVAGNEAEEVKEEDLQRMPYLKAVVMEGLRRHPPAHFVLPHAVSEDVAIDGYVIPKGTMVNFAVAEMGWNEGVWEEPLEFKPERFLEGGAGHGVDVTGSREIKMMPFGAGRRICAGLGVAMLHLEYFVANLVREFEWKTGEGEEVDLVEKNEITIVMKHPLRARLYPRTTNY